MDPGSQPKYNFGHFLQEWDPSPLPIHRPVCHWRFDTLPWYQLLLVGAISATIPKFWVHIGHIARVSLHIANQTKILFATIGSKLGQNQKQNKTISYQLSMHISKTENSNSAWRPCWYITLYRIYGIYRIYGKFCAYTMCMATTLT